MKNPITVLERLTKRTHKRKKIDCKSLVTPHLPFLLSHGGVKYLRVLSTAAHLSVQRHHDLDLQKAVDLVTDATGIHREVIKSIADHYVAQITLAIDRSIKKITPRGYL